MGAKVTGMEATRAKFIKLGKAGIQAFRGAVYAEGLHIIAKAVARAPAVTGRLRNSHFVTHPSADGDVTIGFATNYAASVEYGIRVINMNRQRQKAAFASMRETGWKKSGQGGPGFFRGAIASTKGGRLRRVRKSAARLFAAKQGFVPSAAVPSTEKEARAKGR